MHRKNFTVKAPLDKQEFQIESLLSDIAKNGMTIESGTYVGTGATQSIKLKGPPQLVIIIRKMDVAREISPIVTPYVFAFALNEGASYVNNIGLVTDAVTSLQQSKITLGSNTAANTVGVTYIYFSIG